MGDQHLDCPVLSTVMRDIRLPGTLHPESSPKPPTQEEGRPELLNYEQELLNS